MVFMLMTEYVNVCIYLQTLHSKEIKYSDRKFYNKNIQFCNQTNIDNGNFYSTLFSKL